MKKSRFTEAQIVGILKEVEMGAKVAETCRKHGVSEPTYYKWKSQFSGMTVSHLAQLRQLQDENAKLKRSWTSPFPVADCLRHINLGAMTPSRDCGKSLHIRSCL